MNIIVNKYGSDLCYCRPDTTWERENKDFYSPECVNELYWTPVIFARISKAGKCIGAKFVSRYYDAIGFGALLYIGKEEYDADPYFRIAAASCADHTSLLPFPLYDPSVAQISGNIFKVQQNGECIFQTDCGLIGTHTGKDMIEKTICNASSLTSLRIGDFVAAELAPTALLTERSSGTTILQAVFCENIQFDKKLIF